MFGTADREAFAEVQVAQRCAMHAAHNVVGTDDDPALSLESFLAQSVAGQVGMWSSGAIVACFKGSAGFSAQQLGKSGPCTLSVDRIEEFIRFGDDRIQGFIYHLEEPEHWAALQCLHSTDGILYQHVDSVGRDIHDNPQVRRDSCSVRETSQFIKTKIDENQHVLVIANKKSGDGLVKSFKNYKKYDTGIRWYGRRLWTRLQRWRTLYL